MTQLTQTVLAYQKGETKLQSIFEIAAPLIYYYPIRSRRGSEDECGEFLLFFHNRLIRLVHRFQKQEGKSFESYLYTAMRFQYTTFFSQKAQHSICCENHQLHHNLYENQHEEIHINLPEKIMDPQELILRLHKACGMKKNWHTLLQKRILILVLMNCTTIKKNAVSVCAKAANFPEERLHEMIDILTTRIEQQRERSNELRRRRNTAFVYLFTLQQKLNRTAVPQEKTELRQKIKKNRAILEQCRQQLTQYKNQPLQCEIARVLQISRGSVHVALNYLKRISLYFEKMDAKNNIESGDTPVIQYAHDYFSGNKQ